MFVKIIQGTQLKYHVPPFPIRIIDSEDVAQNPDGIEIEIEDSWTIEMVLVIYFIELSFLGSCETLLKMRGGLWFSNRIPIVA